MLQRLRVQNFKCLLDTSIDFEPLTVLIGPNDSGKSSLLEAVYMLGWALQQKADKPLDGPDLSTYGWRRQPGRHLRWEAVALVDKDSVSCWAETVPSARPNFSIGRGLRPTVEDVIESDSSISLPREGPERPDLLALAATRPYHFYPEHLRWSAEPTPAPVLNPTGSNLAAVLDALLTGPDRNTAVAIERAICDAIPSFRGISLRTVRTLTNGTDSERAKRLLIREALKEQLPPEHYAPDLVKTLDFVLAGNERPPVVIPVTHASDGALLVTAYMALAYSDTPGILLIEEPENGIHLSRLRLVMDLLRKITRGEVGNRPRQIILTTHSPLLLNLVRPEEVRIVRRSEEGATQVTPLRQVPDIDRLLEEFAVGELWYLLEEEGLLRGQRP